MIGGPARDILRCLLKDEHSQGGMNVRVIKNCHHLNDHREQARCAHRNKKYATSVLLRFLPSSFHPLILLCSQSWPRSAIDQNSRPLQDRYNARTSTRWTFRDGYGLGLGNHHGGNVSNPRSYRYWLTLALQENVLPRRDPLDRYLAIPDLDPERCGTGHWSVYRAVLPGARGEVFGGAGEGSGGAVEKRVS